MHEVCSQAGGQAHCTLTLELPVTLPCQSVHTLFMVTVGDLHNFLRVTYSLKQIVSSIQCSWWGVGEKGKEIPHEYKVIPLYFPKHPHKDSSF